MPNRTVAMDAWVRSACYPRRTFYPLSAGPSTRDRQITMTDFRLCLARRPCSQASFCHCTQHPISDRIELTIARLRYSLGGDRPSQTAHHTRSRALFRAAVRHQDHKGWYFKDGSTKASASASKPTTYPTHRSPNASAKLQRRCGVPAVRRKDPVHLYCSFALVFVTVCVE